MAREAERRGQRGSNDEPPSRFPETPPAPYHYPHADLVLQAVMELKKGEGELRAKVDRLIEDVKSLEGKIDSQGQKIETIRRRFARAGGIIAVLLALAAFVGPPLGNALFERVFDREEAVHPSDDRQVPLAPPK